MDILRSLPGVSIRVQYRQGRHYYLFDTGRLRCAATFVGDMGLVKMALASEDLYYAFRPNALIVLGIAAGFSGPDGDVKICDVAVAKSIDLYFHRARNRMGHPLAGVFAVTAELREEQPIATSEELVAFATTDEGFAAERMQWSLRCAQDLEDDLKPFLRGVIFDSEKYGVAMCPEVRGVRLVSGELLSEATEFVDALKRRGCGAADMEAGGAAIAYRRLLNNPAPPKLLVLRGISDRGDEQFAELLCVMRAICSFYC